MAQLVRPRSSGLKRLLVIATAAALCIPAAASACEKHARGHTPSSDNSAEALQK
jgi:hypothetical protein